MRWDEPSQAIAYRPGAGGRCLHCRAPVGTQYPQLEIAAFCPHGAHFPRGAEGGPMGGGGLWGGPLQPPPPPPQVKAP